MQGGVGGAKWIPQKDKIENSLKNLSHLKNGAANANKNSRDGNNDLDKGAGYVYVKEEAWKSLSKGKDSSNIKFLDLLLDLFAFKVVDSKSSY